MATLAIVDDDESIGFLLKSFFEEKGFKVWRALDLNQFFGLIRDNKPDLVIMDIQMPGGSGVMAVKALRKSPDTKDVPVIMLSAMPMDMQKQWLADCGGTVRFAQKPVDLPGLLQQVNELLQPPGADPGPG
jgi:two-component system phosphate regulon response regulator PhoB